jgi:hypothetical protein
LLFSQKRYALAFSYAERSKARALVDMLANKRDFSHTQDNLADQKELVGKLGKAESMAWLQDETLTPDDIEKERALVLELKQEIKTKKSTVADLVTVIPLLTDIA